MASAQKPSVPVQPLKTAPRPLAANPIVRHVHAQIAHHVVVPKESVAELFALAEHAIDDLKIPLQNDDRYAVGD
jgi:hypothetical protein